MKKFLLSMAAVAFSFAAASAEEVTLNVNDATDIVGTEIAERPAGTNGDKDNGEARHFQPLNSLKLGDFAFTFTNPEKGSTAAYYYEMSTKQNPQATIRNYNGCTMTITAPEGSEMTQIIFAGSNGKTSGYTVNTGDLTINSGTSQTWTGSANSITISYTQQFRIKEVTITYGSSDKETVAMPVFTPASGATFTDNIAVTIAAADGADIYYTLDGTNPTTDSNKYEAAIVLTSTTTVKAIAVKEGMNNSGIATAVYTKEETRATLSELIVDGLDDENTEFTYTGKATVTYVNGKNMYIEDETAALLVYGQLNTTYTQGDVITGFKGTFKNYYGTWELMANAASFGEAVEKVEVEPAAYTIGTLTANDQNKYIILTDVTVYNVDDVIALRKGSDEVPMYNKFKLTIPADGEQKDVIGVISYYQDKGDDAPKIQIYPIEFLEANAIEAVETENGVAEYYSINGVRVNGNNLQPGIYVVRTNGKAHKVVIK